MNGLYISSRNLVKTKSNEPAVYRKIMDQFCVLQEHFNIELVSDNYINGFIKKVLSKLPLFSWQFGVSRATITSDIDFIYFRYDFGDYATLRYLHTVKRKNQNCKIILELATYPFRWYVYPRRARLYYKYKCDYCDKRLHKYVDRVITYNNDEMALGVPNIITSNGIKVASIKKRNTTYKPNCISIIHVSSLLKWHRVDRFINGLIRYYGNGGTRDIVFHIVGNNNSRVAIDCQKLVDECQMMRHVVFHGFLKENDLDDVYDICDLAVEMLPSEDISSSSLKSREYWAKGLPMITSASFSDELTAIDKYIYRVSQIEKPVDINSIISFYDSIYCDDKSKERIADEIRSFAMTHYDMSITMKPIIEYIKS